MSVRTRSLLVWLFPAIPLFVTACNSVAVEGGGSTGSTGHGLETTGGNTTREPELPDATGDLGTTAADSSTSGEREDDDTGTDTDEGLGSPSFQLFVEGKDDGDWSMYRYRVLEGVSEGLVQTHEDDGNNWYNAHFLSDERVLYRVGLPGSDFALRLGSLDDRLLGTTSRVDDPKLQGNIVPHVLPDESVVYGDAESIFHVELDGLTADEPVLLGPSQLGRMLVDPQGRYVVTMPPADENGVTNLARVTLADQVSVWLTDVELETTVNMPLLTSDGEGAFFFSELRGSIDRLEYRALGSSTPSVPVAVLPDVVFPDRILWSYSTVRPAGASLGVVVFMGDFDMDNLFYVAFEDGNPAAPVQVNPQGVVPTGSTEWSSDGRWLFFLASEGGTYQRFAAYFGSGDVPVPVEYGSRFGFIGGDPSGWWSEDRTTLYFSNGDAISRATFSAEGELTVMPIAGAFASVEILDVHEETQSMLVAAARGQDDTTEVYIVDVSDGGRADPLLLSVPSDPEEGPTRAEFSPDGRVVAYHLDSENSAASGKLVVVSPEAPGQASVVAPYTRSDSWQFLELP